MPHSSRRGGGGAVQRGEEPRRAVAHGWSLQEKLVRFNMERVKWHRQSCCSHTGSVAPSVGAHEYGVCSVETRQHKCTLNTAHYSHCRYYAAIISHHQKSVYF
ncbi:hypothetical protein NL108_004186 [Boleophthalmus pectinirostris]|nr:hypothetical protein NL108_004186 [Boleophthalmus pectinirostris]